MGSIAIVIGTRPEIIKMSPVIALCKQKSLEHYVIHTNQHYSDNLDQIFFEQLQLSQPTYSLGVQSETYGEQIGKMLQGIKNVFLKDPPSFVLVHGDTNTTLAGALSATKLNIPIGHVEAGLRSHDRKMPEEVNRIITDHLSELCFTPTTYQKQILLREGIANSRIYVTGNTIVDAITINLKLMNKGILKTLDIKPKEYILTTFHRPENVENRIRLEEILNALSKIARKYDLIPIAPLHPRTIKNIKYFNIKLDPRIRVIEPLGYMEFLALLKHAKIVLTDSGGIQEEACIIGIPCVTARQNTERPETLKVGANVLGGITQASIIKSVETMIDRKFTWQNPFGDGAGSNKIIEAVLSHIK